MLCGPAPGTRRFKQAGRVYQSLNNLKMCHCVTEQKQNNNCLMTQFNCGLVLIARNENVFIICTVLHCYGCPHLHISKYSFNLNACSFFKQKSCDQTDLFCLCCFFTPQSTISNNVGTISCFPGLNQSKERIKCLAQGHNTVTQASLEPFYIQSTALPAEPLCSQTRL